MRAVSSFFRSGGETGRREGLKIPWDKIPCGFDPRPEHPAGHGGDALQLAQARQGGIDLVLTHIVMPAMSGRELVDALRSTRPDVRVIYMSGYTDDEIVRRGLHHPSTSFIQKPSTAENLAMQVRKILDAAA